MFKTVVSYLDLVHVVHLLVAQSSCLYFKNFTFMSRVSFFNGILLFLIFSFHSLLITSFPVFNHLSWSSLKLCPIHFWGWGWLCEIYFSVQPYLQPCCSHFFSNFTILMSFLSALFNVLWVSFFSYFYELVTLQYI